MESRRHSGLDFEKRIQEMFIELGYEIVEGSNSLSRYGRDYGVDFVLRQVFPFEEEILVETKYYVNSLVPGHAVRSFLQILEGSKAERALLITTIGFTVDARKIAKESGGKVSLLTELELIQRLPRRQKSAHSRMIREEGYIKTFYNRLIKNQQFNMNYFLGKVPSDKVISYFVSSIPRDELISFILEHSSKDKILREIIRSIPDEELVRISQTIELVPNDIKEEKARIEENYRKALNTSNKQEKGSLLEKVVKEIIELVPGLKVTGNKVNNSREEIDLEVRNQEKKGVWSEFDGMIFIECKNWSDPVDVPEIRSFEVKLENHGLHAGILVAVNGITGKGLDGARGEIKAALSKNRKIVVLDGNDIEEIFQCADVSDKVDDKFSDMYK